MGRFGIGSLSGVVLVAGLAGWAVAQDKSFEIVIENHRFEPEEIVVPAGEKVKLVIKNLDATPEEFESYDLNREKIVDGNGEISVFVGPLDPGTYGFFGEFHQETAQGRIVAK